MDASSIAHSLARYLVTILELLPFINNHLPKWLGSGGMELFGDLLSINALVPILLIVLTLVLCKGVRESSIVNGTMIVMNIVIVLLVIISGAFEVDVSNWTPFTPNGFKEVIVGATMLFFSYLEFGAVAHSVEECKKPKVSQMYVFANHFCVFLYSYIVL